MTGKFLDEKPEEIVAVFDEDDDVDDEEQNSGWDEWKDDDGDADERECLCLFCDLKWSSVDALFDHCASIHAFDFIGLQRSLDLSFYESFKLINYVRSQVAANKCWACGVALTSKESLENHLHEANTFVKGGGFPWQADKYLQPFMKEDALLHSFAEDDVSEDDSQLDVDREEWIREIANIEALAKCSINGDDYISNLVQVDISCDTKDAMEDSAARDGSSCLANHLDVAVGDGAFSACTNVTEKPRSKNLRVSSANVAARKIRSVNENYFGSYGSFVIHREMLSDKVRMDAYQGAISCNPSLFHQATVMDIGCGTGILSLFAAQAGASFVLAVEASEHISKMARQIVKDNGMLRVDTEGQDPGKSSGVIKVVCSMVEDLDQFVQVPHNSIDVLVSEWMGYCLMYESMLSSVLFARDKWLKPGGAILPDTATIFVAGFGKGGTSIPFWENVCGFNMSCIGKVDAEDASRTPIIDIVKSQDLVTDSVVLHEFDLVTMKLEEMDFTANVELRPRAGQPGDCYDAESLHDKAMPSKSVVCYGLVLWFETGFTSRFCKEMPATLSTSPYTPKTHWYQTLLTFREPIPMYSEPAFTSSASEIGRDVNLAAKIILRISIARAVRHRSIDISVETSAVTMEGRKLRYPAQIFNL
ncbi:putative protein arginine N-methyltransferase 3 [Nymphaea thermarum]|nr:putative protein arginine N-methyltransferase 3 [Nymphaea thermarum]